eukprot:CAMPEP_0197181810 /NCGR_PEP_ID=MMETSP1423-20130617/5978_1 /TAXON_ID=476441 /ORGANISM="Pseudo-nitzschia heimii, Strain UNC1101" /LENGTH=497 /DNA_ID=CAMNT_0042632125 /DNA_START=494 /DNA_END=1987 /DNA_ORIENTATION=+
MSDDAAFLSNDPFIILGLDAPTADKKVLKRAYKKRALKFHPDVVTDIHSTPEEKKKASDRFAKINGAYEQLMGKGKGNGKTGDDATSSSSSDGWTPPHRRTSSYKSSSSSQSSYSEGGSTDWKDYMPNYDENYDTGGDSFSQIFSDIFTGAASAAVSGGIGGVGGGIFNEFLEFLEGGAGAGFAGGNEDDADLRDLLKTGTMEEVAEEMDDTEMVVKQLETKSKGLDDEIFALDAEARMASRFSEKISLEEKGAELKARKDVVTRYLERARRRLLSLQTRYKDLIAYGGAADDSAASGGRRENPSSWSDVRDESYSSSSQSSRSSSSYGSRAEPSSTSGTEGRTNADDNDDNDKESWRTEGFGSGRSRGSSRRRGSARRRASSRRSSASSTEGNSSPPSPSPAPPPSYSTTETRSGRSPRPPPRTTSTSPSTSRSRSTSTSTSTSTISKSNYSYDVPPHRRTTGSSSFASRQEEDRKRMSEIKVDEEFEKLKKELGL